MRDVAEVPGADGVAVAERDRRVRDDDAADARVLVGTLIECRSDRARQLHRRFTGRGFRLFLVGQWLRPERQVAALHGGGVAGGVEQGLGEREEVVEIGEERVYYELPIEECGDEAGFVRVSSDGEDEIIEMCADACASLVEQGVADIVELCVIAE